MAYKPETKKPGDLIKSEDWNVTTGEVARLETDKLNHTNPLQITGNLSMTGSLGVGTPAPDSTLHVVSDDPVIKIQSKKPYSLPRITLQPASTYSGSGTDMYTRAKPGQIDPPGAFIIATKIDGKNEKLRLVILQDNGNVGLGKDRPGHPLELEGGAYCDGKRWSDVCSREHKTKIEILGQEAARATVAALNPVTFRYREGDGHERVGFIAEDVPELVAQTDRKGLSPMDILAVVTRVVQDQQREIEDLRARLTALVATGTG